MKRFVSIATILLGLVVSGSAAAQFMGSFPSLAPHDPPGRVFPGKYFEYKAQFYLHKHDYNAALEMFELSGFWADKRSQYNAGLMYFSGIGVPMDKARGAAWLGIAAENRDDLSVAMLQKAYAMLTPEEKQQADRIWNELNPKYGDAASITRALKNFGMETHEVTGSHVGFVGNLQIAELGSDDPSLLPGSEYYRRQRDSRDALISEITGHVTVGAVTTLPEPSSH